jgi:hypothetical protein
MARRVKSLHHNLGDKNVVFHREHRSKKNRRNISKMGLERARQYKLRKLEITIRELENEKGSYTRDLNTGEDQQ